MLKATIIGNLGSDPELRYSASGAPLLRCNVAANYRVRTPEGEWADKTEWCRVTVFGNRAESLANLLKKGTRVYVEGRLDTRPWTAQNGEIRAGLEIAANEVELMSPRQQDDGQQASRPSVTDERRDVRKGQDDDDDLDSLPF